MTTVSRMPAAFVGHGSPMNTLEVNRFTSAWRDLGRKLPLPRAVLAISAHWYINGTAITAMPQPRVIHDFYGFPRELFEYDYPAPGAPDIAAEIVAAVKPSYVGLDHDSWGLDHGTWSVLAHVLPEADVPVLQLSLHGGAPFDYHFDLGARLAPLRDRGIFILCSGNVVHNLGRMNRTLGDRVYDWGERFDAQVKTVMTSDPNDLPSVASHGDYGLAVPTPEHFLPLVYLAGLCSAANEPARAFAEGGQMGSITMTSYLLGDIALPQAQAHASGAELPDPATVPPEQTNV